MKIFLFIEREKYMKVLIDIPNDHKRVIDNLVSDGKGYLLPQEVETRLATAVKIGTVIPNNATNGDMVKAILPILDIKDNGSAIYVHTDWGWTVFDGVWWNTPYIDADKENKE
jgi:hypothetical protein